MVKDIKAPITKEQVLSLKAGDRVRLSGTIYAARDAAHKGLMKLLDEGAQLPFELKDNVIYYVGPCPARPGQVIGSAGPTTSSRMDAYSPRLIALGLTGMIGKGARSKEVIEAMVSHGAVYFGATGGAGALIAESIVSEEVIAFPELGPEAIRKLQVENFPLTVIIDAYGHNLYETGREKYRVSDGEN